MWIICLIIEIIKEFYDIYFKTGSPEYICKSPMQIYLEEQQKNQQK